MQFILGLISILIAEVVRDIYHIAGHYWQPIKQFHLLHHKAYRRDFSIANMEIYQKSQLYNDVPEALCMVGLTAVMAVVTQNPGMWMGCIYSCAFLIPAFLRSQGKLLATDLSHKPGDLEGIPALWRVNRTYHWRHHFDETNAYYAGHFTSVDRLIGTSLALKGKVVAVTGASGALGSALITELIKQGAKVTAITTNPAAEFAPEVTVLGWQLGLEAELLTSLRSVDILVVNHGINVYGDRSVAATYDSFEVNTFSALRLAELFLSTVTKSSDRATKELWVNTSEAEVNPAFSPLYELSKRTLGDLVTLRRLDAPCIIRKLVLGPFKSQLNPSGVMSAEWVAGAIIFLAKRDFRNIIVTINPLTYLLFPIKEFFQSLYFRLFTKN
ncbi:bifunctional sterol desaturase/short chain dehydrogenase [Chamaesiphon sp. GL140_3_metabinner_50]|uniref:bifunctional sterol desaturase/short chain dehydrogenase n=1 Tax=Chamaesiphon sp. GL140_3_metabinner_50 TaxID=2970812 RepID=UPI0025F2779F|nr:bifunctional sterol desaturase/short chain dehydrogenase [Chamaesiphon sp. GL140_3_metabinner_50]